MIVEEKEAAQSSKIELTSLPFYSGRIK